MSYLYEGINNMNEIFKKTFHDTVNKNDDDNDGDDDNNNNNKIL